MARIGGGTNSNKDKLKDIKETQLVDLTLIKHYKHILAHYDNITANFNDEIAMIAARKLEIAKEYEEAPARILALEKHLAELIQKHGDLLDTVHGTQKKIEKLKKLRARVARLELELQSKQL